MDKFNVKVAHSLDLLLQAFRRTQYSQEVKMTSIYNHLGSTYNHLGTYMASQSCVHPMPTNDAEKSGKVAETPLVRTLTYWEEQKHQENLRHIKSILYAYMNEPKWEEIDKYYQYEKQAILEDRKIGHKWVTEHLPILENNPRLAEYVAKAKSYRGVEDRPTIYNSGVMEAFEEGKRQIENEERYLLKQKEEQEKKRIERIAEQEKAKLSAIEAEARRRIKEEEDAAKRAAEEAAILAKMAEIKAEDAFKKRINELNGLF